MSCPIFFFFFFTIILFLFLALPTCNLTLISLNKHQMINMHLKIVMVLFFSILTDELKV